MTGARDLVTIDGLPLHPLVVHAVVVLLPLSAVGAVLIALRPAWRRRYGGLVAVLAVLGVAAVPVAQQTGEQLEARLAALQNPLIAQHAQLGATLLPYGIVFSVLVLALVLIGRLADRGLPVTDGAAPGRKPWRVLLVVVAVLAVLSGVVTTVQVVRIGHSGSTAVWDGVAGTP
ncbi:MAG: DUF2231 domain-containing protein [Pseudonocardiaceae bacterium]